MSLSTRTVAFYLPQYHRIPENDLWWGEGFTDWYNVSKARPLFPGHEQPDFPGELGCYDLLDESARLAQSELDLLHGIDAFCYHHYWFSGRRLLEGPLNQVLESGTPQIPFCISWANEDWTRQWSGSGEVLVKQTYSAKDDAEHGLWLASVMQDPRYLRVQEKAVLLVYRAFALPEPRRTGALWRQIARDEGAGEVLLCSVRSSRKEHGDPGSIGFDAAVEFQPDWRRLRPSIIRSATAKAVRAMGIPLDLGPRYTLFDYHALVAAPREERTRGFPLFPCVTPGWDNSPRRTRNAIVVQGSTPGKYRTWVADRAREGSPLLFVNAWNEWAEGCHLEPGARWGRAYLEAHRDALAQVMAEDSK